MNPLVRHIRSLLRRAGVDVVRHRPPGSQASRADVQRQRFLDRLKIDTAIDVGANTGQYAAGLRRAGFQGSIVSFEPVASAYEQLAGNRERDPHWRCHRLALGIRAGQATIHVAANNAESSSMLPMLASHRSLAPQASYVGEEQVAIARLDEVDEPLIRSPHRLLLKIDVQGTERAVLEGAEERLPDVHLLEIELTLVPLYQGQALIEEMIGYVRSLGFYPVFFDSVFDDPHTGRMLQLSGLFERGST